MLLLQRQSEAVDDGPEDLEEFRDAVVVFRLVDEPVEDVVDLLTDEGAQPQELAVDPVEGGLEEVAFARVLRVEQV